MCCSTYGSEQERERGPINFDRLAPFTLRVIFFWMHNDDRFPSRERRRRRRRQEKKSNAGLALGRLKLNQKVMISRKQQGRRGIILRFFSSIFLFLYCCAHIKYNNSKKDERELERLWIIRYSSRAQEDGGVSRLEVDFVHRRTVYKDCTQQFGPMMIIFFF